MGQRRNPAPTTSIAGTTATGERGLRYPLFFSQPQVLGAGFVLVDGAGQMR